MGNYKESIPSLKAFENQALQSVSALQQYSLPKHVQIETFTNNKKEQSHKYLRYPNQPNLKEKVPDYRESDQYKYDVLTYSTGPKKYPDGIKFFGQSAQYYREKNLK